MKVYLLIEFGGQWEDYYEYIIGCYASHQMAIDEKLTLEEENETAQKQKEMCQHCLVALENKTNPDCNMCQIRFSNLDMDYYCENASDLYENKYYKIKELEVIE